MIRKITLALVLGCFGSVYAQIGIGTSSPDNDAVLEVTSEISGVLVSRVLLQNTAVSAPLTNHVAGMIVYNTSTSGTGNTQVFPGFYYNDGKKWIRLEPLTTTIGDVKQSLLTEDHNGWYILDGRNKASLPPKAQMNATSIGFGAAIPDATDRFLKGKTASEPLSNLGGNNVRSLSQANLPNVTFNGIANTAGNHTHDYEDKYHGVPENLNLVTGLLGILSGILLNILNNNVGSGNVSTTTSTSSVNGNHQHTATVSTGGNSEVLPIASHMVTNTFVYLGK